MRSPLGLRARQVIPIGSALLLALASTGLAMAQEPSSAPSATPVPTVIEGAEASPAPAAGDDTLAGPLTLGPWQRATLDDSPPGFFIRGVAAGDDGIVAVGNREFDGPAAPAAWFSADGISWQRATFPQDGAPGLMEAAAATADGWFAVGRDIPEHARAWISSDGLVWDDVTDIEAAAGHIMLHASATPAGLLAIGCEAENHCDVGVAWRSADGRDWTLAGELPIQRPMAVGSAGETVVTVGQSDGWEMTRSDGVVSRSTDGTTWEPASRTFRGPGGFVDMAQSGDELLAVGIRLGERGPEDQTRLYVASDGSDWERIRSPALRGWDGLAVTATDGLVLVAGTRPGDVILPTTIASHDRQTWTEGTFAAELPEDYYHVFDVTFAPEGDRAVMVGADAKGPAIWYAEVVPVPGPVVATGEPVGFQTATVPESGFGVSVQDIISGGPGYIAVGGGSDTGLDLKALVWTSEDGMSWAPATLKGKAANGIIEAVAPLPGGGYVAVGRDFAPAKRPPDAPANALVWHSEDGTTWTRVKAHKSFQGAVLYDVTPTADGVVAVGCRADFHCREGRVWTSRDGRAWKLRQQLPMAPFTVSTNAGTIAAGGIDNAFDLGAGRAVIASDAGAVWGVTEPLGKRQSQMTASTPYGEGVAMVGWQIPPDQEDYTSAIYVSPDGETWERISDPTFEGLTATGVDASGELMLVVGVHFDAEIGTSPLAYWTRDMDTFEVVGFPDDLTFDGLDVFAATISDDGSMAFAAGRQGHQPAIWYSPIE